MTEIFIGCMSGTSLDGIDLVAASFGPLQLHGTLSLDFKDHLKQKLLDLTTPDNNEIERMGEASIAYGRQVATGINTLIERYHLNKSDIGAIGCHGQTIRHCPAAGFTVQIGDVNQITELTGLPVVADFRQRDMAAGGQGAPLVPAFHAAIWQDTHQHRVIVNLGGIANISILPKADKSAVYGFDTGPANLLLDAWCLKHTGQAFDHNGMWAAQGQVLPELLALFLHDAYFSQPAPKSTGRERFNMFWLTQQLATYRLSYPSNALAPVDVQATLVELTVKSVADAILATGLGSGDVIVCGGGAFNSVLLHRLQQHLNCWIVRTSEPFGLGVQWVEATAFAWLAARRLKVQAGNLPSVTGASGERILGGLWLP